MKRGSAAASVWDRWGMEAIGRVPRYYKVSPGIPKSIFKTHVTVVIFLYYILTFIVTVVTELKVKTLGHRWMEGGGFVRDQSGKGGRHRFCISNFRICILNFGIVDQFDRDQVVGNKKGSKNRGHFLHKVLEPIYLLLQEILGS